MPKIGRDAGNIMKVLNDKKLRFKKKTIYQERTGEGRYKLGTIIRELRRNNGKMDALRSVKDYFLVMSDGERHLRKLKDMIEIDKIEELKYHLDFFFGAQEKITTGVFQNFCKSKLHMKISNKAALCIFFRVDANSFSTMSKSMFAVFLTEGSGTTNMSH